MTKKAFRFYDWNESATGYWSIDTGLHRLRDEPVSGLVSDLWNFRVYQSASIELLAHGNPRKAAELAREIRAQHIVEGHKIREQYGVLAELMFDVPLEQLPSKPEEYPILSRVKAKTNELLGRK
jgi:hypothetical protein